MKELAKTTWSVFWRMAAIGIYGTSAVCFARQVLDILDHSGD